MLYREQAGRDLREADDAAAEHVIVAVRRVKVGHLQVDGQGGVDPEGIERFPFVRAADLLLQVEPVYVALVQPVDLAQLLLLDVRLQHQGMPEARSAEAHVAQPGFTVELDQVHVVRASAGLGPVAMDARQVGMEPEAQLGESGGKQAVLLEAIAAAPAQQDSLHERIPVEPGALVAENVDVLVRNLLQVQEVQLPQRLQIGAGRA